MPKIFITPENQNDFYTVICKDFRRQKYIIMISWFIIQVVVHIFFAKFPAFGNIGGLFRNQLGLCTSITGTRLLDTYISTMYSFSVRRPATNQEVWTSNSFSCGSQGPCSTRASGRRGWHMYWLPLTDICGLSFWRRIGLPCNAAAVCNACENSSQLRVEARRR